MTPLGTNEVYACPACDSCDVQKAAAPSMENNGRTPDWTCRDCLRQFDTPKTRPRKQRPSKLGGLAGDLLEADPDEVSR